MAQSNQAARAGQVAAPQAAAQQQQAAEAPGSQGEDSAVKVESKQLAELTEKKNELLGKVHTMKKELQDWRSKLDTQVKSYRNEIGDLRQTLNSEVDSLRSEFLELKAVLKQQLELTAGMAAQEVVEAEQRLASATTLSAAGSLPTSARQHPPPAPA